MTYGDGLFAAYYAQHGATPYVPRLPSDYQEAEYLWTDASGTYIDTGLKITADDVIECRVMFTGGSTNAAFIGDGNTKTDSNFAIWLAPAASTATYDAEFSFGDGGNNSYKVIVPKGTIDVTQWHTYKAEAGTGKAYIDGELVGQASVKGYSNSKKLVLFGSWRGSNTNSLFIGRMGECRIWRSGELIKHYVPALLKLTQEVGFFDMCAEWSPFRRGATASKIHLGPCPLDELAELVLEVTPPAGNLTVGFWKMDFVASSEQYVDWGDGNVELTAGGQPLSHTYAQPGTYVVRLQCLSACSHIECAGLAATRVRRLSAEIIPNSLFYNCTDVTMSDAVFDASGCITLDTQAFRNASSLAITRLPRTLGFIGNMAFQQTAVTISTIPATVERIYTAAFRGCNGITSITFESTPEVLESDVFASCANLTDIYVPWDSADSINANAPWGATNAVVHYNQTT